MNRKKKIFTMSLVLGAFTLLGGCQKEQPTITSTETSETKAAVETATLVLQIEGKEVSKKEVKYKKDTTVYDILADTYEITDDKGFITSIDGHKQDEKKSKYWMYTINGEMAQKGAKETKLSNNDQVVFNLQVVK